MGFQSIEGGAECSVFGMIDIDVPTWGIDVPTWESSDHRDAILKGFIPFGTGNTKPQKDI